MLIFDLTKKSPDFLIRTLTYTLNQKSISIFISLELRASSLSFSVLFSSGMVFAVVGFYRTLFVSNELNSLLKSVCKLLKILFI